LVAPRKYRTHTATRSDHSVQTGYQGHLPSAGLNDNKGIERQRPEACDSYDNSHPKRIARFRIRSFKIPNSGDAA
jgi:hypothetical protein